MEEKINQKLTKGDGETDMETNTDILICLQSEGNRNVKLNLIDNDKCGQTNIKKGKQKEVAMETQESK